MKKIFLVLLCFSYYAHAQYEEEDNEPVEYQTAAGLYFDLNNDNMLYGVQIKQFLRDDHAVNAQILLGKKVIIIGADYTYNAPIPFGFLAKNMSYFGGIGAQVSLLNEDNETIENDKSSFAIRPALGLEYKMSKSPLAMHVEWKPWWTFGSDGGFELASIGVGVKYVLNRDIW